MQKLIVNATLFAVGLFLAGFVVIFAQPPAKAVRQARELHESLSSISRSAAPRVAASGSSAKSSSEPGSNGAGGQEELDGGGRILGLNIAEQRLQERLVAGEGRDELRHALQSESSSLRIIRTELLRGIPNYVQEVLPLLREWSMQTLLERFSVNDWKAWPKSDVALSGEPTEARKYVSRIEDLNPELGSFLETAAHLLYQLNVKTERGEQFDLNAASAKLIERSEELLPDAVNGVPRFFNSTAVLDRTFIGLFERERCRLVSQYTSSHSQLSTNIGLLMTLDARHCSPGTYNRVAEVLNTLAARGSVRLRADVLSVEAKRRSFDLFARSDEAVKTALAELYAVSAVDALEQEDARLAYTYLGESVGLRPGLRSQEYLNEFFRVASELPASDEEAPQRRGTLLSELSEERMDIEDEGSSLGALGTVLLTMGLLVSAGFVIRRIKLRREKRYMPVRKTLPNYDDDAVLIPVAPARAKSEQPTGVNEDYRPLRQQLESDLEPLEREPQTSLPVPVTDRRESYH